MLSIRRSSCGAPHAKFARARHPALSARGQRAPLADPTHSRDSW